MIGDLFEIYSHHNLPGLEVRYHQDYEEIYLFYQGEAIGNPKVGNAEAAANWADGFFAAVLSIKEHQEDDFNIEVFTYHFKQLYPLKNDKGNS